MLTLVLSNCPAYVFDFAAKCVSCAANQGKNAAKSCYSAAKNRQSDGWNHRNDGNQPICK